MALGAVVQYLGRYTHRVAISNSRIVVIAGEVTFRWKDYRKGFKINCSLWTQKSLLAGLCDMCCRLGFTKSGITAYWIF
ncbi:MAG: transposase [Bacteroidetes bacterium]|nr:transposase [Bacteroidota bacterium]